MCIVVRFATDYCEFNYTVDRATPAALCTHSLDSAAILNTVRWICWLVPDQRATVIRPSKRHAWYSSLRWLSISSHEYRLGVGGKQTSDASHATSKASLLRGTAPAYTLAALLSSLISPIKATVSLGRRKQLAKACMRLNPWAESSPRKQCVARILQEQ